MKISFRNFIISERGDTKFTTIIFIIVITIALYAVYEFYIRDWWETVREAFEKFIHSFGFK